MDIQNVYRMDGQACRVMLMPHLPIKMAKHISSKEHNIGDTQAAKWMAIILKRLATVSPAFQIIWMQPLCGAAMAKFTSIKAVNSGVSIH